MKYGLDDIIKEIHLLRPLRFVFYFLPGRRDSSAPIGERIRLALEELGPIFIKFGQTLSTRRDLLPDDIGLELAKLQDKCPPFPAEESKAIIETALGGEVSKLFSSFDDA
ncbi:MAG: AarF/UbiB family protein, partial [Woeseiaceae bacterium]|nr:AarF/UbiB family protein [Woeseiaceae bacterium]